MRLVLKERETQRICYFICLKLIVVSLCCNNHKKQNGDSAATWTKGGLYAKTKLQTSIWGRYT